MLPKESPSCWRWPRSRCSRTPQRAVDRRSLSIASCLREYLRRFQRPPVPFRRTLVLQLSVITESVQNQSGNVQLKPPSRWEWGTATLTSLLPLGTSTSTTARRVLHSTPPRFRLLFLGYPPPDQSGPVKISQNNLRVWPYDVFATLPSPAPPGTYPTLIPPPLVTPPPLGKIAAMAFPPEPPDPHTAGVPLYEDYIDTGRFYPTWGNHDYHQPEAKPAEEFFGMDVPYNLRVGNVELFAIDSNECVRGNDGDGWAIPPGESPEKALIPDQKGWLVSKLNASTACWKVAYMHHPAVHGGKRSHKKPDPRVLEFIEAVNSTVTPGHGLDLVLSGHVHAQGDATRGGIDYYLSGAGGRQTTPPLEALPQATSHWASQKNGFAILEFETFPMAHIPGTEQRYAWFLTTEKLWPGRTIWYEQWNTSHAHATEFRTKECKPAECIPSASGCSQRTVLKTFKKLVCPPRRRCTRSNHIWTEPRPSCPGEDQLIAATIHVAVCCDYPAHPIQCVAPHCCPIIAEAHQWGGGVIASVCLTPSSHGVFAGESGCIFDRFNLPAYWTVRVIDPATTYRITCPMSVKYECCNCTRTYQ